MSGSYTLDAARAAFINALAGRGKTWLIQHPKFPQATLQLPVCLARVAISFEEAVAAVRTLTGEPVERIEAEIRDRYLLGYGPEQLERLAAIGVWPDNDLITDDPYSDADDPKQDKSREAVLAWWARAGNARVPSPLVVALLAAFMPRIVEAGEFIGALHVGDQISAASINEKILCAMARGEA